MKLLLENWRKYLDEEELSEGKTGRAKKEFNAKAKTALMKGVNWEGLFKALKIMPKGKQMHSMRVGGMAAVSGDEDAIIGALMHDYVERGGDLDKLVKAELLTRAQAAIVLALSSTAEEVSNYAGKNEPLHHMKGVLGDIENKDIADTVAMIKMGDRVDNLNRRALDPERKGALKDTPKYLKKSVALINYLRHGEEGSTWKGPNDKTQIDGVLGDLHPDAKQALGIAAAKRGHTELAQILGFTGEIPRKKKKEKKSETPI